MATELAEMADVRVAPTNNRSVLGVMNEFAFHGERLRGDGLHDLEVIQAAFGWWNYHLSEFEISLEPGRRRRRIVPLLL